MCHFEVLAIDVVLCLAEPAPQGEEEPADEVAFDLVVGVVAFGEVDEGPREHPQQQRKQLVERNHYYITKKAY